MMYSSTMHLTILLNLFQHYMYMYIRMQGVQYSTQGKKQPDWPTIVLEWTNQILT